jgi:hypothetical protein
MSVEALTYAAPGARLTVLPEAARSVAEGRRMPRSLSDGGRALVSVDLAEIQRAPCPPRGRQSGNIAALPATIEALKAETERLEARAAEGRPQGL